ncbi:MAG: carbamoyltransferase HypF [Methylococcales bacterium]|nr:carbamoyltransferase HypF [Methylococcales bacterium]
MSIKQLQITFKGLVQGVGFRPFIYRLATDYQQKGWVANSSEGVTLVIEGDSIQQNDFLTALPNQLPPFATLENVSIQSQARTYFKTFEIRLSAITQQKSAFVLPDISPCQACRVDLLNPHSRFYRYPFTSCCYCGPRYSIMKQQPYDRIRTSMAKFTPCSDCQADYNTPENRRFHSQTLACSHCGPQLFQLTPSATLLATTLTTIIHSLKQGKIIALKGVGGFQLIVDATNDEAVKRLRLKKQRPHKPFALLVETLAEAESLCHLNAIEQQTLSTHQAPIVLLKRRKNRPLPDSIAPNNSLLGLMLPASPLHQLLAHDFKQPLVVTSGNRCGDPICINDEQALIQLTGIADYFFTHNRPIIRPLDDSIVRVIHHQPTVFRRARGYTPFPITLNKSINPRIAMGGHLKNTIAISLGNQLILSQHLGDLTSLGSRNLFQQTLTDMCTFYGVEPTTIIHDLHPDYYSTQHAQESSLKKRAVPHHHAHILASMAEHDLQPPVLGFAWDGVGLGADKTLWGGECLGINDNGFQRIAHFKTFPLVGGDKAANEPRRAALGILYSLYGDALFSQTFEWLSIFSTQELKLLRQSLNKQLNTPQTSSVGRLFDAVSSLLDVCHFNQFEGQAAILLEQLAARSKTSRCYPFILQQSEPIIIDWHPLILGIIADKGQVSRADIAAKFHNTLAEISLAIVKPLSYQTIVLNGGCFQNALLTESCITKLENEKFCVYTAQKIPPNDGGLALGQLFI